MKLPTKCPECNSDFDTAIKREDGSVEYAHLIIRSELDFHSEEPERLEDMIYECSRCHTLFRATWKLESFYPLEEARDRKWVGDRWVHVKGE